MGCGSSTLGPEADSNNPLRRYSVVRPITEEPPKTAPPLLKDDEVFSFRANTKHEEAESEKEEVEVNETKIGGLAKPPLVNVIGPSEGDTIDRDDAFNGPASPSFREYCIHSRCPSTMEHSFDDSDSTESNDNMGNDDSSKPPRKEITNPRKEPEKKERKGRKLRDVINKGRSGGRKMNFARHRSGNKSQADGSRNRVGRLA